MVLMQDLEPYGYLHCRNLAVADRYAIAPPKPSNVKHVPDSLCVYYDLVVDDHLADTCTSYDTFYNVITSTTARQSQTRRQSTYSPMPVEQQRRFIKNDERRINLISEFVLTEDNYVASLRSFVSSIVQPIRSRARDKQRSILGPYECSKIFMNVEQLLQANEAFRLDLARYQSSAVSMNFGDMCLMHMRRFATCYRKFLLGVENAQSFNIKEQKHNATYEAYLNKLKVNKGNQTVYDYLALPGQRVGRYTMFFKELIKHTTDDHSDLPGLTEALKAAEEIANMSEDYHTKLIKIFHNMLQSIQNCPASLISQQRSLICHLDAVEHDLNTGKPAHPVTLFLFTDKLMVARRPSYAVDGLESCGLDHERDKSGMLSLLARKADLTKRYDRKLKFRGWMGLSDIEVHDGVAGVPGSFTLVAATSEAITPTDVDPQTRDALEGYFLEDSPRLFSISCTSSDGSTKTIQSLMQERQNFVEQFGRQKLSLHRMDDVLLDWTCCLWNDRYFFANIYRLSSYHQVQAKNEVALVYIKDPTSPKLKSALSNSFMIPHMLGLVSPANTGRHIITMRSKLALGCTSDNHGTSDLELSTGNESEIHHFRDRLLGNLYACDKDLREVGRMATSLSTYGRRRRLRYANQIKPISSTFRKELNRRRSMNTFKLFSGLGSPPALPSPSNTAAIASSSSTARRKSVNSDEFSKNTGFMESRISRAYSSASSNSNDSEQETAVDISIMHQGNKRNSMNVRRKSLNESIASMYRPSVHPSQTVSYELMPGNRSSSNASSNKDLSNENVKKPAHPVQRKRRDMPPEYPPKYPDNNISQPTISTRSSCNSPTHLFPGCRKSWGGSSTQDPFSSRSTLATPMDSTHDLIPPLMGRHNGSIGGTYTPFSHDLLGTDHIQVDEKVTELLAQIKSNSPLSSSSSESCQTPPPAVAPPNPVQDGIDKLMLEMDMMKSEFNRKYSNIIQDYEEMGSVVRQLTRELRKRDEELATLRIRYRDCIAENDLLYEAFNHELDQMFDTLGFQRHQRQRQHIVDDDGGGDDDDDDDTSIESQRQHIHHRRPSHPSPEMQIRRKLEVTMKERNQWHQTACKLARELQNLTQGLEVDIPIRPTNSTSSPSPNVRR
ncbi:hypothetical protein K492DRAFT_204753 [Lichtheimia hyalospora FSU 10163]|nr:hypothetical protein K492DRAFT_204753 [Lichtheimia hyalospora FSU 10163]